MNFQVTAVAENNHHFVVSKAKDTRTNQNAERSYQK